MSHTSTCRKVFKDQIIMEGKSSKQILKNSISLTELSMKLHGLLTGLLLGLENAILCVFELF